MRALLIALLAGCAGAEANTPQSPTVVLPSGRDLGLHPGESMSYDIQVAGVLVGEAQLAVGDIGMVGGKKAIIVKSRAATAGVAAVVKKIVDESTTVIDVETGHPLQVDTYVVTGEKTTSATAKFEGRLAHVTYQHSNEAKPRKLDIDFRTEALHDMHSAMANLRGWRAAPGTTRPIFIVGGRRLWRIDMTYVGEDTVASAVGSRRAVVFEGKSYRARRDLGLEAPKPSRTFKVWLSDDADRVPLRCVAHTELGDLTMDLTEYQRP
jgi:hypothetical protein